MKIICLLGRSGTGKSTIEQKLQEIGYSRIISYTSRPIRPGEQNGREYHFVSSDEFEGLIKNNILMEYTRYSDHYYGAPKPVGSINYVVVVELQGYLRIKKIYGNQAIGVYLDISDEELERRLNKRNDTDSKERIKRAKEDATIFKGIKDKVDLVIDANQTPHKIMIDILRHIKENN